MDDFGPAFRGLTHTEARKRLEIGAAQGHPECQAILEKLRGREAQQPGWTLDFTEARRLMGLSAAQGDADAQYNVGHMHFTGVGAPQDIAEATRQFTLAAAQGNASAQRQLA